jgi:hypothetical protein
MTLAGTLRATDASARNSCHDAHLDNSTLFFRGLWALRIVPGSERLVHENAERRKAGNYALGAISVIASAAHQPHTVLKAWQGASVSVPQQ